MALILKLALSASKAESLLRFNKMSLLRDSRGDWEPLLPVGLSDTQLLLLLLLLLPMLLLLFRDQCFRNEPLLLLLPLELQVSLLSRLPKPEWGLLMSHPSMDCSGL
jgi:hypothetical protein